MAVVVQGVVLRALPGDGGLWASTNATSENNGLPCLTRDLTQGNDEFWGNCRRKESVPPVLWAPSLAHQRFPNKQMGLSCCLSPALLGEPVSLGYTCVS